MENNNFKFFGFNVVIVLLLIMILFLSGCARNGSADFELGNYESVATEVSMDVEYYKDAYVLFHAYNCPHCKDEIKFLEEYLPENNLNLDVYLFEVLKNDDNRNLFEKFAEYYNTSTMSYPRAFVNNKVIVGFDEGNGATEYNEIYLGYLGYQNVIIDEIDLLAHRTLDYDVNNSIVDFNNLNSTNSSGIDDVVNDRAGDVTKKNMGNYYIIFLLIVLYIATYPIFKRRVKGNKQKMRYWFSGLAAVIIISAFVFVLTVPEAVIATFASGLPFWVFVFILALADGFNPCAFTVLFILLSLLTYTKKKNTMFMIGNVFVITSAIMYFIFIMVMVFAGSFAIGRFGDIILKILGVVILITGIINLKDYLFFKKGVSLSISDKEKSKITKKARAIVKKINEKGSKGTKNLMIAIGSTFILAVGVNLVELGCSAILPAVYMSSLIKNFGSEIGSAHIMWTVFYSVVYVIPLFAILFNFIHTFKSERLSEGQGRVLKLVAGVLMLVFGVIMIFKPGMLGV